MTHITLRADFALLIARLIIGGIFIYAGYLKVTDMQMTLGMFSSMNIPVFLTYIVSYGELIGGILLILGLWTTLTAIFLSIIMMVAIYLIRSMGIQLLMTPMSILAALLVIWGAGAGKYSIGKKY